MVYVPYLLPPEGGAAKPSMAEEAAVCQRADSPLPGVDQQWGSVLLPVEEDGEGLSPWAQNQHAEQYRVFESRALAGVIDSGSSSIPGSGQPFPRTSNNSVVSKTLDLPRVSQTSQISAQVPGLLDGVVDNACNDKSRSQPQNHSAPTNVVFDSRGNSLEQVAPERSRRPPPRRNVSVTRNYGWSVMSALANSALAAATTRGTPGSRPLNRLSRGSLASSNRTARTNISRTGGTNNSCTGGTGSSSSRQ